MGARSNRRSGSAMIEFVLVGIPLIFVLISIFEMARGMWLYHTLAYAVKEGVRYSVVHGQNCWTAPNNCKVTVQDIARRVLDSGVGLVPEDLNMMLGAGNCNGATGLCSSQVTCNPATGCLADTNFWPAYPDNQPGLDVMFRVQYPFRSAIAMFWPGSRPQQFGLFTFSASSRETIQF